MNPTHFSKYLLQWYDQAGRKNLPWRKNITAYHVWVSEIMLQQTQVKTVIPYFNRFIQCFPNLAALAHASEDEVLHLWTGLGYYSRARNLHHAAKNIQTQHKGIFPKQLETLLALPGIGRSTAGAILSIAFNIPTPILDANVKRIISRFHTIQGLSTQSAVNEKLWHWAQIYTPTKRVADYTQAIMDLGATICTRAKPQCSICPLQKYCQAHLQKCVTQYPSPKPRKTIPLRAVFMLIFHDPLQNAILLEKRPPSGIWASLWSLPECTVDQSISLWCQQQYGIIPNTIKEFSPIKHIFSHFQLQITPVYINSFQIEQHRVMDSNKEIWYNIEHSSARGFAAPVHRLLQQILAEVIT